jgi:hypothetical protein
VSDTYTLNVHWSNADGAGDVPAVGNIHVQPAGERSFYFYKNLFGTFVISDEYGDADPNDSSPTVTGGGGGGPGDIEGASPGTINDGNRDDLGLLAVRNLTIGTYAANITAVTFTKVGGGSGPFTMDPGPLASHERSILLSPGTWDISIAHDGTGPTNPAVTSKTVVNAASKPIHYVYFYRNRSGQYVAGAGDEAPTDSDPSSTTPEVIVDGWGTFRIFNNTHVSAQVVEIEWLGNPYSVTVLPGDTTEIQIPPGTGQLRFRIGTKTTFGQPVVKSVRESAVTEARYDDSLEDITNIPTGFGLLTIENRTTTAVVESLEVYKRDLTSFTVSNASFEPSPGPITSGQSGKVLINNGEYSNGVSGYYNYIVQIHMRLGSDYFNIERMVYLYNNMVTIQVTQADIDDGSDGTVPDPDPNPTAKHYGALRVFNAYERSYGVMEGGGPLIPPLRIFKFYLDPVPRRGNAAQTTGPNGSVLAHTYPAETGPADEQCAVPSDPDNHGKYDSTASDGTIPARPEILVGNNAQLRPIHQGVYNLKVVAGFYTWDMYTNSAQVNGQTLTEGLITYDCGDVVILEGYETQFHFSPPGNQGRDVPTGFVTFWIGATNQATSTNASYVEMIVPPAFGWGTSTGVNIRQYDGTSSPQNKGLLLWRLKGKTGIGVVNSDRSDQTATFGSDNTHLYFAGTTSAKYSRRFPFNSPENHGAPGQDIQTAALRFANITARTVSPSRYVIFNYGQVIPNGSTKGPFIIPPGEYWCRYWDNYSGGNVYGATAERWRYVDLRGSGGSTAYATLDNTTRFQWLGQEVFYEDDMTNPVTGLPWVNPPITLAASGLAPNARITWKKPTTTTNYAGVLLRITDADNGDDIIASLGNIVQQTKPTSGWLFKSVTEQEDDSFPFLPAGNYLYLVGTVATDVDITLSGLPTGHSYDISVRSYTTDLGTPSRRRYSIPIEMTLIR